MDKTKDVAYFKGRELAKHKFKYSLLKSCLKNLKTKYEIDLKDILLL